MILHDTSAVRWLSCPDGKAGSFKTNTGVVKTTHGYQTIRLTLLELVSDNDDDE